MAFYNLSNEYDREKFDQRVEYLRSHGRSVEMTEKKPPRTLQQNKYLHLILQCFAMEYKDTMEYVKEEYYKKTCNRDLFVYLKYDPLKGRNTEHTKSSRELTSEEMSLSIDRFKNYAAVNGIFLPDADKPDQVLYAQQEVEKYAQYL